MNRFNLIFLIFYFSNKRYIIWINVIHTIYKYNIIYVYIYTLYLFTIIYILHIFLIKTNIFFNRQHNNESYSAAYNYYKTTNTRNVEIKRKLLQSSGQLLNNKLKKSWSSDNVVISSRGFKPSDIHDPAKRHFLENLSTKILHFDMVSYDKHESWKKKKKLLYCYLLEKSGKK